jgi:geranylgeranyl diphosphate synthase type II
VIDRTLEQFLSRSRQLVENALDDLLPPEDNEPVVLHQAMRYSVFAGGKRIRPVLVMAAAQAVGNDAGSVLPLAVSLECIHTYSLVHDDLPAMDNDDMRRGKPTLHKVFGDAVAILAGDALLTFAFSLLTSPAVTRVYRADRLLAAIHDLATAAGSTNLIAGQVMDIMSEGKAVDSEIVNNIMKSKTGALIRASLTCGARLAGGDLREIRLLGQYGECLGQVFQIRDDLLDLEGDPEKLGKAVKKDQQRGKATYPRLFGEEKTRALMRDLMDAAVETIKPLGDKADLLSGLVRYVGQRIS